MLEVRIPATSANLGSGFDAFGIAFQLYNTFQVTEKPYGGLKITGVSKRYCNKGNLFYQAMQTIFRRVCYHPKGLMIHCDSRIPFSRGLGSSAACIAGGMTAANMLSGNVLSEEEVFRMAVKMEGHPDNLGAAFYGGLIVSMMQGDSPVVMRNTVSDSYIFYAIVPDYPIWTEEARSLLPEQVAYEDAAFNISAATMTYLALTQNHPEKLRICMQDRLHQIYRKTLIKDYDVAEQIVYEHGGIGFCISGSGPTMLAVVMNSDKQTFRSALEAWITGNHPTWQIIELLPDDKGIQATEKKEVKYQ